MNTTTCSLARQTVRQVGKGSRAGRMSKKCNCICSLRRPLLFPTKAAGPIQYETREHGFYSVTHEPAGDRTTHNSCERGETGLRSLVHTLAKRLKERERMLIFFNSCDEAERFSAQNQCPVFHSKLPKGSNGKEFNMQLWESGKSKMMACTSAFGAGVDKPNVRFVVIHSPKYSLMSVLQAAERAGRAPGCHH
jgi:hypothetical protein